MVENDDMKVTGTYEWGTQAQRALSTEDNAEAIRVLPPSPSVAI